MDKKTAINLLGGTAKKVASAIGYRTVHAVYMWPETLPDEVADRVYMAKIRSDRCKDNYMTSEVKSYFKALFKNG